MPKGTQPALNGHRLTPAQLATARLMLPCALPYPVTQALQHLPLLGAGLLLTAPAHQGPDCFEEHLIAVFPFERLLAEALDYTPGRELLRQGYLPLGDAGRRKTQGYFVSFNAGHEGELYSRNAEAHLFPLGLRLKDLPTQSRAVPGLHPRRRLPPKRPTPPRTPRRIRHRSPQPEALTLF